MFNKTVKEMTTKIATLSKIFARNEFLQILISLLTIIFFLISNDYIEKLKNYEINLIRSIGPSTLTPTAYLTFTPIDTPTFLETEYSIENNLTITSTSNVIVPISNPTQLSETVTPTPLIMETLSFPDNNPQPNIETITSILGREKTIEANDKKVMIIYNEQNKLSTEVADLQRRFSFIENNPGTSNSNFPVDIALLKQEIENVENNINNSDMYIKDTLIEKINNERNYRDLDVENINKRIDSISGLVNGLFGSLIVFILGNLGTNIFAFIKAKSINDVTKNFQSNRQENIPNHNMSPVDENNNQIKTKVPVNKKTPKN